MGFRVKGVGRNLSVTPRELPSARTGDMIKLTNRDMIKLTNRLIQLTNRFIKLTNRLIEWGGPDSEARFSSQEKRRRNVPRPALLGQTRGWSTLSLNHARD